MNIYGYSSFKDELAHLFRSDNKRMDYYQKYLSKDDFDYKLETESVYQLELSPVVLLKIIPNENSHYKKDALIKYRRKSQDRNLGCHPKLNLPTGVYTPHDIIGEWIKQTGQNDLTDDGFSLDQLYLINDQETITLEETGFIEYTLKFHPRNPEWFGSIIIDIQPYYRQP